MFTALDPFRSVRSPFHSQAISITGFSEMTFLAGQGGVRPDGTRGNGIAEQTVIAMENVVAVLAEGDMSMANVAKLTIYLTQHDHIPSLVEAASPFLPDPRPAATLLIVGALADPSLLVQVEAVAAR